MLRDVLVWLTSRAEPRPSVIDGDVGSSAWLGGPRRLFRPQSWDHHVLAFLIDVANPSVLSTSNNDL